jgi:multidrug efflux pump subunit AcrB
MNPGEFSVKNNRMVMVAMAMAMVGGIIAYLNIGRLEDPEFTIKQALIITPYPGASGEEVAQEVSNPIETACQQLAQLDRVESESSRGRSAIRRSELPFCLSRCCGVPSKIPSRPKPRPPAPSHPM